MYKEKIKQLEDENSALKNEVKNQQEQINMLQVMIKEKVET